MCQNIKSVFIYIRHLLTSTYLNNLQPRVPGAFDAQAMASKCIGVFEKSIFLYPMPCPSCVLTSFELLIVM